MNRKKTMIEVPHAKRKELIAVCGATYPTVRKALNGFQETKLAKKIRHVALTQFDGVEYEIVKKEAES